MVIFIKCCQTPALMYQSIPSLTIPPGDPGDSHILIAQGSDFRQSVIAQGGCGGFESKKYLTVIKKVKFSLCFKETNSSEQSRYF